MIKATEGLLKNADALSEAKKSAILEAEDKLDIKGRCFYVSNSGNDENDGRTPESAWKTLARVSDAELERGDGVLFCRGDIFRGFIKAQS